MVDVQELYQALLKAAKEGDLKEVDELLQSQELYGHLNLRRNLALNNEILKAASIHAHLPKVAKFKKTHHLEIVERLLEETSIRSALLNRENPIAKEVHNLMREQENGPEEEPNMVKAIIEAWKEYALIEEAKNGNLGEVVRLLRECKISRKTAKRAAKKAAQGGHLAVLKSILNDVREEDLPFVLTINNLILPMIDQKGKNEHLEVLEYLLNNEVIKNSIAEDHHNAVFRAAVSAQNFSVVDRLLQEKSVRDKVHVYDDAALNTAVINENLPIIYRIVLEYSKSADPDQPNFNLMKKNKGLNTLLEKKGFANLEIFMQEYLPDLKRKYDALDKDMKDDSSIATAYRQLKPYYLQWAAGYGHLALVEQLLLEPLSNQQLTVHYRLQTLKMVVRNGHIEVLNRLLQNNAFFSVFEDFGVFNDYSNALLYIAIRQNNLAMVERLLQEPSIKNKLNGQSITAGALPHVSMIIINRLLQEEPIRNDLNCQNNMTLLIAVSNGLVQMVKRLLRDENVRNHPTIWGEPGDLLINANRRGSLELVDMLLQLPLVQNNVTAANHRALWEAIIGKHFEIAYRIALEYKRQGIAIPQNFLSNGNFKNVLKAEGFDDFPSFMEQFPTRIKLNNKIGLDTMAVMREGLADFLVEDVAGIIENGYVATPESINNYRILQPYFQAQQAREKQPELRERLLEEIRQGGRVGRKLHPRKGEGGSAAAAAD